MNDLKATYTGAISGALAMLFAGLYAGILGGTAYYISDAIGYMFMISSEPNEFTTQPVESLNDVWVSQINHWHITNGRFVCHLLVQTFCALLPEWIWGVSNGILYALFICLLGRFSSFGHSNSQTSWGSTCWIGLFSLLILAQSPCFTPPIEINYPWAYALECAFIYRFLKPPSHKGVIQWILWVLLAFCAGQWNEAFAIPIGASLIVLFCFRRGRFSAWEWSGSLLFGMAAVLLCLAPGNFIRMENLDGNSTDLTSITLRTVYSLKPLIAGGAIILILYGFRTTVDFLKSNTLKNEKDRSFNDLRIIIISCLCFSYILGLALGFSSGTRVVAASVVAFLILITYMAGYVKPKKYGVAGLAIAGALFATLSATHAKNGDFRYRYFDDLYSRSDDGRVYVPADMLREDWYDTRFNAFYLTYKRKAAEPGAPALKLLPLEALTVRQDSDYNAIIPLNDKVWLFVRSRKNPSEFRLRRRLGIPETPLTVSIPDRVVDFVSPQADIPVDTLPLVNLGLYVNNKSYLESTPYIAP